MTSTDGDPNVGIGGAPADDEVEVAGYESFRHQRIKQNLQKLHALGILHLSRNLKPTSKPKNTRHKQPSSSSSTPTRRSFRLKGIPAASYAMKKMDVKPEVYTEDHEKMLGDHVEKWKIVVGGDDGGNEMRSACCGFEGNRCHQCRRKIAGIHSKCCKGKTAPGLFCGNCLFKRYGENVLEASANPDWVCPVCRDICNCSLCRRAKGWEPIGNFYSKALHLGFKSVAHHLIHTHGPHRKQHDRDDETSKDLVQDDREHVLIKKCIKHYDHDQQCERDNGVMLHPDMKCVPCDAADDEGYSSEYD